MRVYSWLCAAALSACAVGQPSFPESSSAARPSSRGAAVPAVSADLTAMAPQETLVGELIGRYDSATGRLRFSRLWSRAEHSIPSPGFTQVLSNSVSLDDHGSGVFGAGSFGGAAPCEANQLCAMVDVTNESLVNMHGVRLEIYDLTGGASIVNSVSIPTGDPTHAGSAGAWSYGDLAPSGTSSAEWRILTNAGADFNFRVAVWASYTRTSYAASAAQTLSAAKNADTADGTWSDSDPAWRDACALGGSVLSGTSGFASALATPSFPFALYSAEVNGGMSWVDGLQISSAGTLSVLAASGVATDANVSLSDANAPDYTIAPFWDALDVTNGAACIAVDPTSASPARRLVVTWKDVSLASDANTRLTFSIVLREGTDDVWLLYHRWSTDRTICTTAGASGAAIRGAGATVGVRGSSASQHTDFSVNQAFLEDYGTRDCAAEGAWVRLTASPANP